MNLEGKRVAYMTLGCKLNFSETSTIRHSLEEAGTVTVGEKEEADIYIINTCSVTDTAEKKGRQLIRKLARTYPDACIVVMGCYAQLRAWEVWEISGVGLVLGVEDKFNVAYYLRNMEINEGVKTYTVKPLIPPQDSAFDLLRFDPAFSYGDRTRSFLKIQDGCDYRCSYCTIPLARGRSRSATIEQVLQAVGEAAAKGVKEIILTGVNTGDFGQRNGESFIALLHRLDAFEGIERFRISSIEPNLLTEEIIDFVAHSRHFMPHFHIPLQSGSNEVLTLMRRRYTRELFASRVALIRERIPDAFIGVDVIAGMNGESEAFFEDSYRFIEGLDVSQLHVFPYSERLGTAALDIKPVVPDKEKSQRVERLLALSEQKHKAFYNRFVGTTRPVLFEESRVGNSIAGFTDNYLRVEVAYDEGLGNQVVSCEL